MSQSTANRLVEIVQFGMGGVGRALLDLIVQHGPALQSRLGIELRYRALADSQSVVHLADNSPHHLTHLVDNLRQSRLADQSGAFQKPGDLAVLATELDRLRSNNQGQKLVVVDVSGADASLMQPVITAALRQGQRAVLANKRPLCGPLEDYRQMLAAAGPGASRLRYETTVGAALPVISTVQSLLDSGDTIRRISGTFSGTLGYLTSQLENGVSYSQAVREAKEKGYTEPDPRDDLGGVDVARKALILARLLGNALELSDVQIEPLYPAELAELSIPEFMDRIVELDQAFGERVAKASEAGQVLRYAGTVEAGKCRVGLEQVGQATPLGRLKGTNNMIVFETARYEASPLVIQGAGAGAEITASGVLADIIGFFR